MSITVSCDDFRIVLRNMFSESGQGEARNSCSIVKRTMFRLCILMRVVAAHWWKVP
jgi:hypothetical protein